MQNKALMRKVSKEREQEAILRFENQNKKFKCKMENLKITKGILLDIFMHNFTKISIHDQLIYAW